MLFDVSIIIVNYFTTKLVAQCIESIRKFSYGFTYEIIVVDNGSNDSLGDYLLDTSNIKIVKSGSNLGTCKANNFGAKMSSGNYLFFLNPDTILINNAINELKNTLDLKTEVACVGGNLFTQSIQPCASHVLKILTPSRIIFHSFAISKVWLKIFRKPISFYFNYKKRPLKTFYVSAADLLIRRNVFFEIGGWDENVFMYGEEMVLGYLLKKRNYVTLNNPNSKIIHLEGMASKKELSDFSEKRYERFLVGNCQSYSDIGIDQIKYLKAVLFSLRREKNISTMLRKRANKEICVKKINIATRILQELEAAKG